MEPDYSLTQQGFEYQFGVNHIGHFALTGMLIDHFPSIGRVVTVSSLAANNASLNLSITQQHANYNRSVSYAQSKLAEFLLRCIRDTLAQISSAMSEIRFANYMCYTLK